MQCVSSNVCLSTDHVLGVVPGEELVVPKSDPYSPPPSPLNKEPSFWVRIFQFGRRQSTNFVPLAAQRGDDKMVIEARNGRAEVDSTGEVEWKEGSDEPTITEVSSASESLSFVSTNGDGSATEGESTGNTDTSSSFDQGEIEVQQEKEEGQELEHDQKDVEEKEVEGEEKVQDQVLDEEMDRPDSSNSNDTANTLDEVPQDLSDGEDGQGGTEKGPKRDPSEMDEGEQQLLRMSPEVGSLVCGCCISLCGGSNLLLRVEICLQISAIAHSNDNGLVGVEQRRY